MICKGINRNRKGLAAKTYTVDFAAKTYTVDFAQFWQYCQNFKKFHNCFKNNIQTKDPASS